VVVTEPVLVVWLVVATWKIDEDKEVVLIDEILVIVDVVGNVVVVVLVEEV
jgi:hypothetical protein